MGPIPPDDKKSVEKMFLSQPPKSVHHIDKQNNGGYPKLSM